jgi:tRNA pseudouridine38-40 synthase
MPTQPDKSDKSGKPHKPDKLKFKLTIAYDGTNYAGWQVQQSGIGVQQRVEEALSKLFKGIERIHSSSRTDAGVHALGMVAHVEIPRASFKMSVDKLALAINAYLPDDIRVMEAKRCPADFHSRFDAAGKQYRYHIWNHTSMNPLLRHQAWQVPRKLNLSEMRKAASMFVGKHDFKSLAATRSYEMKSTVRTLHRCEIKRSGSLIVVIIEGDGFLYKMCRGIVGTLIQVGQGKIDAGEITSILKGKNRSLAGMTAPANGLVLQKVFYKPGGNKKVTLADDDLE